MSSPSPNPAVAPPPGLTTDFANPNPLWKWNMLCQTACLLVPGIMFVLRTYIRVWIKRIWTLDDYLCCFSFIALAIYSGLLTTIIYKHGGNHEWDMTKAEVKTILYYVNIIQIWYGPAAACIKCTILLLYLRIFCPTRSTRIDIAIRAFMLIICGFYLAISIAKICQCVPRGRIWDKTVPGSCINLSALLATSGLFNIISDVGMLLVPLKGIWNLQMSRKRKIGIYFIFTVGAIAPVFSIIGFFQRYRLTANPDQSYNQPLILLWATAELATGMMVICLPTLPGIRQCHTKKPSPNIVNVNARSCNIKPYPHYGLQSPDTDMMFMDSDYFELREGQPTGSHIRVPQNALINEIRGGEDDGCTPGELGSARDNHIPSNGIVKKVNIEQSHV